MQSRRLCGRLVDPGSSGSWSTSPRPTCFSFVAITCNGLAFSRPHQLLPDRHRGTRPVSIRMFAVDVGGLGGGTFFGMLPAVMGLLTIIAARPISIAARPISIGSSSGS